MEWANSFRVFCFVWLYQQFFADSRDANATMQMVYEIRAVYGMTVTTKLEIFVSGFSKRDDATQFYSSHMS